ncbi:MAG: peptidase [Symploca sp. SIO3C6]|uniref:Peptidase n=1 Tax=Symploca sp. SIO1C4 TaxID=2607765 RepID=A0A6B3NE56_9CYAN|nr:peptidase [Symploca sp. SIO3C6]NER29867.1 peptidase [Symploca sp. SIO1C4]NET07768.1 peptidase [Symploca sp. SIO2B6]
MTNAIVARLGFSVVVPVALLAVSLTSAAARAQSRLYTPLPIPDTNEINDKLSEKDIPTGDGGFARDYLVDFQDGDQVAIDLTSDNFDTIVTLMATDGSTIAENDDGPDGSTNSLLFARISESGQYIIRVRAFGETGGGDFNLKVTRLRPIDN